MAAPAALPPPLATWRHPIRLGRNISHNLAVGMVVATFMILVAAALYFIFFETNADVTAAWHALISVSYIRHAVRNVLFEGFAGGLVAHGFIWNRYKKGAVYWAEPAPRWKIRCAPLLALPFALPGFFVAMGLAVLLRHNASHFAGIVSYLHAHTPHNTYSGSLWTRVEALWTDNFDQKLMGYGAALFFGRRPMKPLYDAIQTRFVRERIEHGKPIRFYHAPGFQARYNELRESGACQEGTHAQSPWVLWIIGAVAIISLGLAGFGWYVLNVIAAPGGGK